MGQSLNQHLEQLNNKVTDCLCSFLSYPERHDNTVIVFDKIKLLREHCDKYLSQRSTLIAKAPNRQGAHEISTFMDQVENLKIVLDGFDKIIGQIAGYSRVGIESPLFEDCMMPLFESIGWNIIHLSQKSPNIELYEFTKGSFKMLIGKNTLPLSNYSKTYNDIEVTLFTYWQQYREEAPFLKVIMRGGKYRLLQYCDDSNPTYHKVTKVTSIRK